jgi:hypothetical protein
MNWEQQFVESFITKLITPSTTVWFGVFEFGNFVKCGDEFPMAIVRRMDVKIIMNPDDADDYMVENGFDSYLIPSQFDGEIYYAKEQK